MFSVTHEVPYGHVCFVSRYNHFYQMLQPGVHKLNNHRNTIGPNISLDGHKYIGFSRAYTVDEEDTYFGYEINYKIIDPYRALIDQQGQFIVEMYRAVQIPCKRLITQNTSAELSQMLEKFEINTCESKMLFDGLEWLGIEIESVKFYFCDKEHASWENEYNSLQDILCDLPKA